MFNLFEIFGKSNKDTEKKKMTTPGSKEEIEQSKDEQRVLDAERAYLEGVSSVLDLLAPSLIKIETDHLEMSGQMVRTLFVTTYPRYISMSWFEPVIDYSVTMDIAMFFTPIESSIVLKQLRNKVGILEAQLMADQEKGAPRDPLRETALRDIEKLRDDLTQGIEHFFQFGLYITIYAKTLEDLNIITERIENTVGSKLVYTRRSLYQTEQGFNSTLPLCNDELELSQNLNTTPVAAAFPFVSSELSSDSGVLYGINRHNNSLILFDRFSLQNANSVVFATSGAGKSYAVKLEILRSMMLGTDILVIDPEREYEHLAEAVGGTYVNISLNSPSKINPFDLPKSLPEGTKSADVIRSAVIALKGLLRICLGQFSHLEDSLMDRALLETYAKKDIVEDCDLSNVEFPTMDDLQVVLSGMEGGADLGERLKKYTSGTFAGLLNHPTNVDIDNQLVIFSVRDLEDELRPIAIYTVISFIWNIVRSEMKKRVLVIDEGWWLMQHEDSAKFVFALAKRCRKYYLGMTTITQDVNDFLGSAYGQAIVTNSSIQLLLKQSPASIDSIAKTFLLTQGERYLLLESGVGEGIFFAGNKHVAVKIVASYAEDQIITSDPRQLLEIEEAKKEFEESEGGEDKILDDLKAGHGIVK